VRREKEEGERQVGTNKGSEAVILRRIDIGTVLNLAERADSREKEIVCL